MPFISFIYRFGRNSKTYYGKYATDYVSDDHEGLDNEVKSGLIHGLNKYRKQKGLSPLKSKSLYVGVTSFSDSKYIPTYSSAQEIKCFDFYMIAHDYKRECYINGQQLIA